MPSSYESDATHPLVLVLHGGGKGDGKIVAQHFGFTSLADRNGFTVAYPNGIDAHWQDHARLLIFLLRRYMLRGCTGYSLP